MKGKNKSEYKEMSTPLGLLGQGEQAEIVMINSDIHYGNRCGRCSFLSRTEDMGLRAGKVVEVLSNGGGPMLLKVEDSRIAIGRGMAMKIMVKRISR